MNTDTIRYNSNWLGWIGRGATVLAAAIVAPATAVQAQDAMLFPIAPEGGVLSVEWQGDEARAGQEYQYTLRVKNLSKVAAHNVVVHQTLPGGFKVTKSSPRAEQAADNLFTRAGNLAQEEAARRRAEAADAAERQMGKQDTRAPKNEREKTQDADNQTKNSSNDDSAAVRDRAKNSADSRKDTYEKGEKALGQGSQERAALDERGNREPDADRRKSPKKGEPQMREQRWRIGKIEPGQTEEIRVTGLPRKAGQLETCVWVSYQPTYCINLNVVKPQLELTQQILDLEGNARDVFWECETIIVRYKLTNPGSGATEQATLTVDLPKGLKMGGDQSLKIEVGALAAGESVERTIKIDPQATGNFDMSATASTGALKASSGTGSVEIVRPELEMTVKAPDKAYLGRSVTYEVEVRNTSDVAALNTVVKLPVPKDARRFASSGKRIDSATDEFSLGRIDAGSSKSFGVTFDPGSAGVVKFDAVARAYCAADVTQQVSTTIEGIPALQISVVDRQDPVKIGEETTYEIRVRNEGSGKDIGIQLTGELSKTLEFIKADGDTKVDGKGSSLNFGKIDRLEPGEVASWLVTVKGAEKGRGALRLQLQSDSIKDVKSSEPTTVF